MTENNVELGIVCDGSGLVGQIEMADLLRSRGEDKTLEDIAETSIVFSPHDSVALALAELKEKGRSMAIVMENEQPSGLFFSDEVLLKLI
jgi:osmoprotectant transport system ATP-binding protein